MKKLFLLALLLCSASLYAQTDTAYAYVDSNYKAVSGWEKAVYYYKAYKKDSANFILSVHNRAGQLQKREVYLDAGLTIKNGQSVIYTNGKPTEKGIYINDEREGLFVEYDTLGNVLKTESYRRDTLNGAYSSYWPNGTVKETGNYNRGSKTGEWISHYESGKLAVSEKYTEDSKLVNGTYLDEEGNAITRDKIEVIPAFPGGINKFYELLGRNMRYPRDAAERGIRGEVKVSFIITETGAIEDIKIKKKLYPSLDQEALRVMKLSPKWVPAKQFGKNVRVMYTIPIRFDIR